MTIRSTNPAANNAASNLLPPSTISVRMPRATKPSIRRSRSTLPGPQRIKVTESRSSSGDSIGGQVVGNRQQCRLSIGQNVALGRQGPVIRGHNTQGISAFYVPNGQLWIVRSDSACADHDRIMSGTLLMKPPLKRRSIEGKQFLTRTSIGKSQATIYGQFRKSGDRSR